MIHTNFHSDPHCNGADAKNPSVKETPFCLLTTKKDSTEVKNKAHAYKPSLKKKRCPGFTYNRNSPKVKTRRIGMNPQEKTPFLLNTKIHPK
jgi:hypothetical protein